MSAEDQGSASAYRTNALLVLGAVLGISAAVASTVSVRARDAALADGVVATVNGVPLRTADYARAVEALASDRRSPLTEADRRHVLNRLIDEELLVQYGVNLGLVRHDRRVRGDLVSAVLAAQVASVDGYQPSAAELRSFYAAHSDFFALPGRLRLAVLWIRSAPARSPEEAMQRARDAVEAVRSGESFEAVKLRLGDMQIAPLPDAFLPPAKVREYLGPTVVQRALAMEPGEVSDPIASGAGVYVIRVVGRDKLRHRELEEIEPQVRAEMKRRAGDDAVRATLDRLRVEGNVVAAVELP